MAASKASTSRKGKSAPSRARFDADALTGLFADPLGGWKLVKLGKPIPAPAAGPQPAVEAAYERGADSAEMTISDDLPNTAKSGQRDFHESARPVAPGRVVTLDLGNGLVITAESRTADGQALRALIESIDLARAEAMKPVAKH